MENLKEKMPIIIITMIAIAILAGAAYFFENYEVVYYTKIDNTKLEKLPTSDDMKYQYKLDSYDDKGKKKELTFKTSRELKEGAYLLLEVRTVGVHSWKEVSYHELPEQVKTNYTE